MKRLPSRPVLMGTVVLACLASAACPHATQRVEAADWARCEPALGALEAGSRTELLAGVWRITLVATAGRRTGGSSTGRLELRAADSSTVSLPAAWSANAALRLWGETDLDLFAVGAVSMGSISDRDQTAPGVAVLVSLGATREITLRLGSDANRAGPARFDGGYTALYVTRLAADRFDGRWASGATGPEAGGHFCAVRRRV